MLFVAGCAAPASSSLQPGGSTTRPSVPAAASQTTSGQASPSSQQNPQLAGSRAISLTTPDGVVLEGREFGDGAVGVVLAHYADPVRGQTMWFAFAQVLRAQGYRVLTFNFRGYCPEDDGGCSGGVFDKVESWRDVVLAADALKADGAKRVFVMGAGLGGHTSLWAASRDGIDFAGVVSVSAPQIASGGPATYDLTSAVLQSITEPKLFIAGNEPDAEARSDAQAMYAAALEPKQLVLLASAAAGPELFTVGSAEYVVSAQQTVLDFLAQHP